MQSKNAIKALSSIIWHAMKGRRYACIARILQHQIKIEANVTHKIKRPVIFDKLTRQFEFAPASFHFNARMSELFIES